MHRNKTRFADALKWGGFGASGLLLVPELLGLAGNASSAQLRREARVLMPANAKYPNPAEAH
jgi:hypothetical protein